jgi:hypothetical protein
VTVTLKQRARVSFEGQGNDNVVNDHRESNEGESDAVVEYSGSDDDDKGVEVGLL